MRVSLIGNHFKAGLHLHTPYAVFVNFSGSSGRLLCRPTLWSISSIVHGWWAIPVSTSLSGRTPSRVHARVRQELFTPFEQDERGSFQLYP
jgi:hypothetical protein